MTDHTPPTEEQLAKWESRAEKNTLRAPNYCVLDLIAEVRRLRELLSWREPRDRLLALLTSCARIARAALPEPPKEES